MSTAACCAGHVFAQSCAGGLLPRNTTVTANGPVLTWTRWDPDGAGPRQPLIVLGGAFDRVGTSLERVGLAVLDPITQTWTDDLLGLMGTTRALLATSDGRMYAAGEFYDEPGSPVYYAARWNGFAWVHLDQEPDNHVWALAQMSDGSVVLGGSFENVGDVPASRVARWSGTQWSPMGEGFDSPVRALAELPNGTLYAGGGFDRTGTARTGSIAWWDGIAWRPTPVPIEDGAVLALAPLADGSLAVGGDFTTIGNVGHPHIARLVENQWQYMSGLSNRVTGLKLDIDGRLYATGDFTIGITSNGAARWTGTSWEALRTNYGSVSQLGVLSPQQWFVSIRSTPSGDAQTGYLLTAPDPFAIPTSTTNGIIYNAVRDGRGGCVVSGTFTTIGGVAANRIARWNGVAFSPLGDGLPFQPSSLYVLRNGDVLATGARSIFNGGFGHLARWDGTTWHFRTFPVNGWLYAATELPSGDIILGGTIYATTPSAVRYVACLNGDSLEPFGDDLTGDGVTVLRTGADGYPIAGGGVTDSIRQWSGTYWRALAEGLHASGGYPSLSDLEILDNGDLLAVGWFNNAGGAAIDNLARWDGTDWLPVAPQAFTNALRQIELLSDGSLVSWQLGTGGISQPGALRRWDGSQTHTLIQTPALNSNSTFGILELNNEIIFYGGFGRVGLSQADNFARYAFSNTPWTAIHPEPVVVSEGQTFAITATPATGYEHVRVRWQRNGVFINDGPAGASPGGGEVFDADVALEPVTNGTPARLIISNAQFEDGGQYTAVFSTDCGSTTSRPASVTVNPACPACTADFNGDGGVTGDDLAAFVAEFEQGFNCADVNADGGVTFDDLAAFILEFQSGGC